VFLSCHVPVLWVHCRVEVRVQVQEVSIPFVVLLPRRFLSLLVK
jgi:hypothetical protein